jgi:hypothetical protein
VRYLFKWLKVERPPGVALHAARTIELNEPASDVFTSVRRAIEDVLGGAVQDSDDVSGTVEATFGLVNSERITVRIAAIDTQSSRVVIESRRGAGSGVRQSHYVEALARSLQRPSAG